jgi:hypothetical protein
MVQSQCRSVTLFSDLRQTKKLEFLPELDFLD